MIKIPKINKIILILSICLLAVLGITGAIFFLNGYGHQDQSVQPVKEEAPIDFLDLPGNKGKEVVIMERGKFSPEVINVKKGESVIWINKDSSEHSVIFNNFRSPKLRTNDTAEIIFEEAGVFEYHCGVNPEMKGKVIAGE